MHNKGINYINLHMPQYENIDIVGNPLCDDQTVIDFNCTLLNNLILGTVHDC